MNLGLGTAHAAARVRVCDGPRATTLISVPAVMPIFRPLFLLGAPSVGELARHKEPSIRHVAQLRYAMAVAITKSPVAVATVGVCNTWMRRCGAEHETGRKGRAHQ